MFFFLLPENGEMNEMASLVRHMILNSGPDGFRPSTLHLGHEAFTSGRGKNLCFFEYQSGERAHIVRLFHLALSGLTVRLPVSPWQQVRLTAVRTGGGASNTNIHYDVTGLLTVVWRSHSDQIDRVAWIGQGGSELIAHIRDIQEIAEDGLSRQTAANTASGPAPSVLGCPLPMVVVTVWLDVWPVSLSYLSKHQILTLHWFISEPPSATLAQH